jgi:hypothetical protein
MEINLGFFSDLHYKHLDWEWTLKNTDQFGYEAKMKWDAMDIAFYSGDMSRRGSRNDCRDFMNWFNKLPCQKVMIAGNHDFFFDYKEKEKQPRHSWERPPQELVNELLAEFPDIHYLDDSGVNLFGLNIWGSPITPWFHDWAFNRQRYTSLDGETDPGTSDIITPHWEMIPKDTDILLTHGPPYGYGDLLSTRNRKNDQCPRVGCKDITPFIEEIRPKIHAFGHIHEAYGVYRDEHTEYFNASCLNDYYEPVNAPIFKTLYL